MSLLQRFFRRPVEPATTLSPDGASSVVSTIAARPAATQPPSQEEAPHHGSHKQERSERRESLYGVVTETMTQVGVLSSSYKFKVLSLDPQGREFVVMMDMPLAQAHDVGRLSEIEALIARNAKFRHGLLVTAVYWRGNDHVIGGVTPESLAQPLVRVAVNQPTEAANVAPEAGAASVSPAITADGALAEEIQAFRKAMAEGIRPQHAEVPMQAPSDFEDTIIQGHTPPAT